MQQKQDAAVASERKSSIGSGDRNERIRTYNFPNDRLTDHRLGHTVFGMQEVLTSGVASGQLDEIIDALAMSEQERAMEQMMEQQQLDF
eukprot:gene17166-23482_t